MVSLTPSLTPYLFTSSDNNLHFVEAPALAPPEVAYDQNDMVRYEQELTEAAAMPLPDVRVYGHLCLVLLVFPSHCLYFPLLSLTLYLISFRNGLLDCGVWSG